MKTSFFSTLVVTASLTTAWVSQSAAGLVVWGPATTISGDTDVSTSGTAVAAFNFDAVSPTTVNGVSFTPVFDGLGATGYDVTAGSGAGQLELSGPRIYSGNEFGISWATPYSGLTPVYQALLTGGNYNDSLENASRPINFQIQGLTIGTNYQIQLWVNDSREYGASRNTTFTAGASSVTLDQNSSEDYGGLGQWVLGSFTADATIQDFAATSSNSTNINAYQLRAIGEISAVPEPASSLAVTGLIASGLLLRRRGLLPL
ncbi:MAG: hypothetical protein WCK77_01440 [Verrucomicrobiota bacterium]